MSEQEKVLEHNYDGIQEFDNPLPNWWLATFYGAIIFGFFYVAHFHFGQGKGSREELAQEMEAIRQNDLAKQVAEPGPTEEGMLALYNGSDHRQAGQKIFAEKCVSCHGPDGGGLIGPNLTDSFWIHGKGTLLDILKVVSEGVPEKGMPPWKGMLKGNEVQNVVVYVRSLKGTHPQNPKAPQGQEVKD